jgi:Xaa-Pro dipeptidase
MNIEEFRIAGASAKTFTSAEYRRRLAAVRSEMAQQGLDLLLVHNLSDVCYLTGYQTPLSNWYACVAIPIEGDLKFQFCDFGLAAVYTDIAEVIPVRWDVMDDALSELLPQLDRRPGQRVGHQARRPGLTSASFEIMKDAFSQSALVDASSLVLKVRSVKSQEEIEALRRAAKYSIAGTNAALEKIALGVTDCEVAAAASYAALAAGSEYFSLGPFVKAGPLSGTLHANTNRYTIKSGDAVVMEVGGVHSRYTAPYYSTAVVGKPSVRMKECADIILEGLSVLYENIRPGRTMDEVAREASKPYAKVGPGLELFAPRHAYSVGLGFPPDWVEYSLWIAEGNHQQLQPGMVFHTARSIRAPGEFSIAFSDTVLVTEDGIEVLTEHAKEIHVV